MGKTDWFFIDIDDNATLSKFALDAVEPLSSVVRRFFSLVFIVSIKLMRRLPITTVFATAWKGLPFRQVVEVVFGKIRNFDVHIDKTILPAEVV